MVKKIFFVALVAVLTAQGMGTLGYDISEDIKMLELFKPVTQAYCTGVAANLNALAEQRVNAPERMQKSLREQIEGLIRQLQTYYDLAANKDEIKNWLGDNSFLVEVELEYAFDELKERAKKKVANRGALNLGLGALAAGAAAWWKGGAPKLEAPEYLPDLSGPQASPGYEEWVAKAMADK